MGPGFFDYHRFHFPNSQQAQTSMEEIYSKCVGTAFGCGCLSVVLSFWIGYILLLFYTYVFGNDVEKLELGLDYHKCAERPGLVAIFILNLYFLQCLFITWCILQGATKDGDEDRDVYATVCAWLFCTLVTLVLLYWLDYTMFPGCARLFSPPPSTSRNQCSAGRIQNAVDHADYSSCSGKRSGDMCTLGCESNYVAVDNGGGVSLRLLCDEEGGFDGGGAQMTNVRTQYTPFWKPGNMHV